MTDVLWFQLLIATVGIAWLTLRFEDGMVEWFGWASETVERLILSACLLCLIGLLMFKVWMLG